MKRIIYFTALISIMIITNISITAQLLNSSFEVWDLEGNPTNWYTSNLPGLTKTISQSSDAHDGTFSVRIDVVDAFGQPFPGSIQSLDDVNQFGHPITENYTNVTGYYKFLPQGSAQLTIVTSVYTNNFDLVGAGGVNIYTASESWVQFDVPIQYLLDSNAASVMILISISDTSDTGFDPATIGSIAYIDNLSMGNTTGIESGDYLSDNFALSQNYPNPFNPITTIEYKIPLDVSSEKLNVKLVVYDILGREVTTLVNSRQRPGNYEIQFNSNSRSVQNQTSGIYFYQLQADDFIETKKMILLK